MKKLLSSAFALIALTAMCGMVFADTLDGGALSSPEAPQTTGAAQVSDSAQQIPEIQDGLKALQNNDIEGALKKFEEARKSHPEFSPAELMLAKLALQINPQNNGPAARMLIERCVKNNPTDPEAFIFLGDYNLGNGSVTEADLLFRQAATATVAGHHSLPVFLPSARISQVVLPRIHADVVTSCYLAVWGYGVQLLNLA